MILKKAISPVVATALLLVVAVVSVVSFQNWFTNFQSGVIVDVEKQTDMNSVLRVDGIVGDEMYLYSSDNASLSLLKINDINGNLVCDVNFSKDVFMSNGLVGYWNFENVSGGVVYDSSGNGNDGTMVGSVEIDNVNSLDGYYASLNGTTDYISVSNDASLEPVDVTISAWVYIRDQFDDGSAESSLVSCSPPGTGYSLNYNHLPQGDSYFAIQDGGWQNLESTIVLSQFKWVHIVGVYNTSHSMMYINGVLNASRVQGGSIDYIPASNLEIGRRPNDERYFNGTIDEVRVYNRALSASEIDSLYRFRSNSQILDMGMNIFNLNGCSLDSGAVYNVVGFTDNQKVDMKVIAK